MSNKTRDFQKEMELNVINNAKANFDETYIAGTIEDVELAYNQLCGAYEEIFGDKYELMMHVLREHCDASLCEYL